MRYRNCQHTFKQKVSVFKSRIHGLGLYCLQEIEAGDMVIEYVGTVIRSVLADKREKCYESKVNEYSVNAHCSVDDLPVVYRASDAICSASIKMK